MSAKEIITRCLETCDAIIQSMMPNWYLVNRWVELSVATGVFTVVVILIIKHTGFRKHLASSRRAMVAAAYEIILYRRRPFVVISAELRLVWHNLRFLLFLLPSLLVAGALFVMILGTLTNRFDYAPAAAYSDIVIRSTPQNSAKLQMEDCLVTTGASGLKLTARVSNPNTSQAWLRLHATKPGVYRLEQGSQKTRGPVVVIGEPLAPAQSNQFIGGVHHKVFYPTAKWLGIERGWMFLFVGGSFLLAIPTMRLLKLRM